MAIAGHGEAGRAAGKAAKKAGGSAQIQAMAAGAAVEQAGGSPADAGAAAAQAAKAGGASARQAQAAAGKAAAVAAVGSKHGGTNEPLLNPRASLFRVKAPLYDQPISGYPSRNSKSTNTRLN